MRHLDIITINDLGLTREEIDFLLPQAEARMKAFMQKADFWPDEPVTAAYFYKHLEYLNQRDVTVLEKLNAMTAAKVAFSCSTADASHDRMIATVLNKDGYGLEHSSYGAVSVGDPSGSERYLVGSSALSQYSKSMTFNFARVDDRNADRPELHENPRRLVELCLSSEQFVMMVRGDNGFQTPCGLRVNDGHWTDMPPATNYDRHDSTDFEGEIRSLMKPLDVVLKKLEVMIQAGASKKDEYAALVEQANLASAEYGKVVDAILAMGNAKGAEEGQRAHRQFVSEMNERLGQLKLGHKLNELLGLSQG